MVAITRPNRDGLIRRLILTKNQHVLVAFFMHSDFLTDGRIRIINFDTNSGRLKAVFTSAAYSICFLKW